MSELKQVPWAPLHFQPISFNFISFCIIRPGVTFCLMGVSLLGASLVPQTVRSLGQKDSLEKGMATHSSILAWSIPWTEFSFCILKAN